MHVAIYFYENRTDSRVTSRVTSAFAFAPPETTYNVIVENNQPKFCLVFVLGRFVLARVKVLIASM